MDAGLLVEHCVHLELRAREACMLGPCSLTSVLELFLVRLYLCSEHSGIRECSHQPFSDLQAGPYHELFNKEMGFRVVLILRITISKAVVAFLCAEKRPPSRGFGASHTNMCHVVRIG